MTFGGRTKKEGVYSPITQNQRHLEVMKKVRMESKNNRILKFFGEKYFEGFNKPVVVLANPKTVLNSRFAKKEIKEKVIRADQLITYMKEMNKKSKEYGCSDNELYEWAMSYLKLHKPRIKDYTKKYEKYRLNNKEQTGIV